MWFVAAASAAAFSWFSGSLPLQRHAGVDGTLNGPSACERCVLLCDLISIPPCAAALSSWLLSTNHLPSFLGSCCTKATIRSLAPFTSRLHQKTLWPQILSLPRASRLPRGACGCGADRRRIFPTQYRADALLDPVDFSTSQKLHTYT